MVKANEVYSVSLNNNIDREMADTTELVLIHARFRITYKFYGSPATDRRKFLLENFPAFEGHITGAWITHIYTYTLVTPVAELNRSINGESRKVEHRLKSEWWKVFVQSHLTPTLESSNRFRSGNSNWNFYLVAKSLTIIHKPVEGSQCSQSSWKLRKKKIFLSASWSCKQAMNIPEALSSPTIRENHYFTDSIPARGTRWCTMGTQNHKVKFMQNNSTVGSSESLRNHNNVSCRPFMGGQRT